MCAGAEFLVYIYIIHACRRVGAKYLFEEGKRNEEVFSLVLSIGTKWNGEISN
jgi:hypothetical protein